MERPNIRRNTMKRVILTLMIMLLPAVAIAQQNDSNVTIDRQNSAGSDQTQIAQVTDAGSSSVAALEDTTPTLVSVPATEEIPAQGSRQAPAPGPTQNIDRPKIEGSMVGYIDNAVIGSRIRIRFDAAFSDSTPDAAEFFYAKCSCYKLLANINDPLAVDPNAPGPGTGVPTSVNFQQLYFNVEYAPSRRFSVFVEVPIRWVQPLAFKPLPPAALGFAPFSNQAGLSDIRGGFKLGVIASSTTSLTVQLQGSFPTGRAANGLGTKHYSIEPAVLFYQRFSRRAAVEAEVGDTHPIGGSAGVPITGSEGFAGDVFFYGIGPSYRVYSGEHVAVAPVIEMVGWRILSGFETVPVFGTSLGAANDISGTNIVNLKAGIRTTIGGRSSFYIGYGQGLTAQKWYNNIAKVEYRDSF
jgi:hypothetical protein